MVGGGSYVEYQNLQQMAKRSMPAKNILYGSTELMNSTQFLEQAQEVGLSY